MRHFDSLGLMIQQNPGAVNDGGIVSDSGGDGIGNLYK